MRDKIGRWLPFGFWLLMITISIITLIICVSLIVAKLVVVWATIGLIGSLINIAIYAIQSVSEWQEAKVLE